MIANSASYSWVSLENSTAHFSQLMNVDITNTYFNRPDINGPNFSINPTKATKRLINDAGLVVKTRQSGLFVAYNTDKTKNLISYLRTGIDSHNIWFTADSQLWLSFLVNLEDPEFLQFTDVPFDLNLSEQCYYVSNAEAHLPLLNIADEAQSAAGASLLNGPVILNPLRYMNDSAPLRVVPGELYLSFPGDVEAVLVLDVWGDVVLSCPREVPADLLELIPGALISCDDVAKHKTSERSQETICRVDCVLNFYLLSAGRYTICYSGSDKPDEQVVYQAQNPTALCFIDLFLCPRQQDDDGIYPIGNLFSPGEPTITFIPYNLKFSTRKSNWNYVIVPAVGETVSHLKFYDQDNVEVPFKPPLEIEVAGGRAALLLRSVSAFPMQDKPDFWLQLRGDIRKRDGLIAKDRVLVSALPTPFPSQIQPNVAIELETAKNQKEDSETSDAQDIEGAVAAKIYVYL